MSDFDLTEIDRLLMTTKQVRKRLDLSRDVPIDTILECIEIAGHAPVGGNLERNRWLIVTDPDLKGSIAAHYQEVGSAYLGAQRKASSGDERQLRVLESAEYLNEHLAEVPAMVIPMRLDRLKEGAPNFEVAGYHGSIAPSIWSFQLAARARGLGSAWTTLHLVHEGAVAELLGIPDTVTQIALLPVAYYTGDTFRPAPRRSALEVTYLNHWKAPVEYPDMP